LTLTSFISSLISDKGAAYLLLNLIENLELIISNHSLKELEIVIKRLNIDHKKFITLSKQNLQIKKSSLTIPEHKQKYQKHVLDLNDAHIIGSAVETHVTFLITYNIKHFKIDSIKQAFDIVVLTPAMFLQYLRSQ
jgi:predicted nucleic acid-binding protein